MFVETRKVWNIAAALMLLWRSADKYNIPQKVSASQTLNVSLRASQTVSLTESSSWHLINLITDNLANLRLFQWQHLDGITLLSLLRHCDIEKNNSFWLKYGFS